MQWCNNNHKKIRDGFTLCVWEGGGAYPLALTRGGMGGGVQFFMIKPTDIGDKIRYSNLSNNMLIQLQFYIIAIQIQ